MKQAAAPTTGSTSGEPQLGLGGVALAFLDTTWRIATPVLIFTILGIWADRSFGTKPWITFICVPVGFAFAVLLVKKQLEAVQKMDQASKTSKSMERKKK